MSEAAGSGREPGQDALNRDVSSLGRLLGDVIREQEGDAALDLVERLTALTFAGIAAGLQNTGRGIPLGLWV